MLTHTHIHIWTFSSYDFVKHGTRSTQLSVLAALWIISIDLTASQHICVLVGVCVLRLGNFVWYISVCDLDKILGKTTNENAIISSLAPCTQSVYVYVCVICIKKYTEKLIKKSNVSTENHKSDGKTEEKREEIAFVTVATASVWFGCYCCWWWWWWSWQWQWWWRWRRNRSRPKQQQQ